MEDLCGTSFTCERGSFSLLWFWIQFKYEKQSFSNSGIRMLLGLFNLSIDTFNGTVGEWLDCGGGMPFLFILQKSVDGFIYQYQIS